MTTGVDVAGDGARSSASGRDSTGAGWLVLGAQECRDLWWSGRGPLLLFVLSVLLSGVTYLTATNRALNFLEQREAVNLVVQFAVALGVLAALIVSADGISGERERGTLETLLVTPVTRRAILAGKLTAALSLWFASFIVSIPYIWVLAGGVGIMGQALALAFSYGTLVAAGLASVGLLVSALSNSNKTSLAGSVLLLLVLFAPTQIPTGMPQGWFFDVLVRVNPVTSALAHISAQLVQGRSWTQDLSYLISPIVIVVGAAGALAIAGNRLVRLTAGGGSG